MITDLKTLEGCTLCAVDGEIGAVEDCYFDDRHWHLRYFVADVGAWLRIKRVLISPDSAGEPRWGEEVLPVVLTKEQIRHSPGIDTAKPMERQQEAALRRHYGWPPYWGMIYSDEAINPLAEPVPPEPTGVEDAPEHHLHSARQLTGYRLQARDAECGHVDNFLIEDTDWRVTHLVASIGHWPHRRVILPRERVQGFGYPNRHVILKATQAEVEGSPPYDGVHTHNALATAAATHTPTYL